MLVDTVENKPIPAKRRRNHHARKQRLTEENRIGKAGGVILLPNNGGRKAKISALDLTFSCEKDFSVIWLLADAAMRREIEAMVDEAVHAGVDFCQDQACVVEVVEPPTH